MQVIQLRDSICALAARICQIASRDRSPTIATERCTDGKTRCQAAIERTQRAAARRSRTRHLGRATIALSRKASGTAITARASMGAKSFATWRQFQPLPSQG